MNLLLGILAILGIVLAVGFIVAVAVVALMRDKHRGTSGTLSTAALEIQSILEPDKKKAAETMQAMQEREEEDQAGDD